MKKGFLIVIPVLIITIVMFYFGILVYQNRFVKFESNGHVIARTSESSTKKYFFTKDSKYRIVDDKVNIETSKKENVSIPVETFIHYDDGSISTFSKSAILDLNDLSQKTYNYYNIYPGTVFTKNGTNYTVSYLDKRLNFNNFLLKISDTKYMIIGNKMELQIGDIKKTINNNYLEVSYLEGNIIKLENQGVTYQNISSDVTVTIGDMVVDFSGKNIYLKGERKLSLGEITIDSDDNIEINKDENSSIVDKYKKDDKKDGSSSTDGSDDNSNGEGKVDHEKLPSVNNGIIDTDEDSTEEIIDTSGRVKDAEFTVTEMDITSNRLRAEVAVSDKDAVLEGDMSVKIIEAGSNKIVYETTVEAGSNTFDIESESLQPETNYILVVNSNYSKNEIQFNKDFIQKTFITEPIGISVEKNYISDDSLEVSINKTDYSNILSVKATLKDKNGGIISTNDVNLDNSETALTFNQLVHNSKYTVELSNFVYKDAIVSSDFVMSSTFTTLKSKPTYGSTTFSLNKKAGEFNMLLKNVSDPDNGITSYRYEVYDARSIAAGDNTPLATINKTDNSSATLKVNDSDIQRGVPYVFRVVIVFDDNDKEYEYVTDLSEVMKIDGVQYPTVSFEEEKVTFERIIGRIIITDDGNTINLDDGSVVTITYTDSVGVSRTITSSGNLNIPIDVNNLRSNETYSFAVSAKVDLQDGNPAIDNCHVGSVIIKTKDPNPFKLNYNVNATSPDYSFRVNAQLVANNASTELEANTLTGIQFNLYEGKTTSGILKKSVKKVDRNLEQYASTLRDDYYDNSFVIDPTLFGLKNSDLTAEYYTIEVTGAYDYTDYKNNLPIKDSVITVKTNGVVPDPPDNLNDALDFEVIRNKDAVAPYKRDDLDGDTIVGYKVRAGYDNSKKYAKSINYQIRTSTGDIVSTKKYEIPASGDIDYVEFYCVDGKLPEAEINEFRRGESYYFTYTADLDLDFDGKAETVYPTSNVILRSKDVIPEKQAPHIKLYPSLSNATKYVWKYKYSDVDHTLQNQILFASVDDKLASSTRIEETDSYKEISFDVKKSGMFKINGIYETVNNDASYQKKKVLTNQYYEGILSPDFGSVNLFEDTNRVVISFADYNNKIDLFNRVAKIDIDFRGSSKTITVKDLTINNGNVVVDYSDIEALMGQSISTKIYFYYDYGVYGFESSGDYHVLQTIQNSLDSSAYYYSYENNTVDTDISAANKYMTFKFNSNSDKLVVYSKGNTSKVSYIGQSINSGGINANYTYYSPKALKKAEVKVSNNDVFSFTSIIPGVSLLDSKGNTSIEPLLVNANIHMKLYGTGSNRIKDNKIFIELYSTNDDASENKLIDTYTFNVEDFDDNKSVKIDNLIPQSNYFIRVLADVYDGSKYTRTRLYDVDDQTTTKNYYFKTIGNVGISNTNVVYNPWDYDKRYLKLSYNLDEIVGYSYIKYEVYEIVDDTHENDILIDTKTENDVAFKKQMIKYINLSGTGAVTGKKYRIYIKPYLTTTINGEETDFELQPTSYDYYFPKLYAPYISISHSFANSNLTFKVNFKDYAKSVVDGVYNIYILDGNGKNVTPSEYKNKSYSINTLNQAFVVPKVSLGDKYILYVNYNANYDNSLTNFANETRSYSTLIRDNEGISIGNVYADADLSDNTRINLTFFDSSKLSDVTSIRYSIYDNNGYSVDNEASFVPQPMSTGNTNYYLYSIPEAITNEGIYFISIQFFKDDRVIDETTLEYRLIY